MVNIYNEKLRINKIIYPSFKFVCLNLKNKTKIKCFKIIIGLD